MALIKCIECGKAFSDRASACPNCGCPTSVILSENISCTYATPCDIDANETRGYDIWGYDFKINDVMDSYIRFRYEADSLRAIYDQKAAQKFIKYTEMQPLINVLPHISCEEAANACNELIAYLHKCGIFEYDQEYFRKCISLPECNNRIKEMQNAIAYMGDDGVGVSKYLASNAFSSIYDICVDNLYRDLTRTNRFVQPPINRVRAKRLAEEADKFNGADTDKADMLLDAFKEDPGNYYLLMDMLELNTKSIGHSGDGLIAFATEYGYYSDFAKKHTQMLIDKNKDNIDFVNKSISYAIHTNSDFSYVITLSLIIDEGCIDKNDVLIKAVQKRLCAEPAEAEREEMLEIINRHRESYKKETIKKAIAFIQNTGIPKYNKIKTASMIEDICNEYCMGKNLKIINKTTAFIYSGICNISKYIDSANIRETIGIPECAEVYLMSSEMIEPSEQTINLLAVTNRGVHLYLGNSDAAEYYPWYTFTNVSLKRTNSGILFNNINYEITTRGNELFDILNKIQLTLDDYFLADRFKKDLEHTPITITHPSLLSVTECIAIVKESCLKLSESHQAYGEGNEINGVSGFVLFAAQSKTEIYDIYDEYKDFLKVQASAEIYYYNVEFKEESLNTVKSALIITDVGIYIRTENIKPTCISWNDFMGSQYMLPSIVIACDEHNARVIAAVAYDLYKADRSRRICKGNFYDRCVNILINRNILLAKRDSMYYTLKHAFLTNMDYPPYTFLWRNGLLNIRMKMGIAPWEEILLWGQYSADTATLYPREMIITDMGIYCYFHGKCRKITWQQLRESFINIKEQKLLISGQTFFVANDASEQNLLSDLKNIFEVFQNNIRNAYERAENMRSLFQDTSVFEQYKDVTIYNALDSDLFGIIYDIDPILYKSVWHNFFCSDDTNIGFPLYCVHIPSVNNVILITENMLIYTENNDVIYTRFHDIITFKTEHGEQDIPYFIIYCSSQEGAEDIEQHYIKITEQLMYVDLSYLNNQIYNLSPYLHGNYFRFGIGVEKDLNKALELYEIATSYPEHIDLYDIIYAQAQTYSELNEMGSAAEKYFELINNKNKYLIEACYNYALIHYKYDLTDENEKYFNVIYYLDKPSQKKYKDAREILTGVLDDTTKVHKAEAFARTGEIFSQYQNIVKRRGLSTFEYTENQIKYGVNKVKNKFASIFKKSTINSGNEIICPNCGKHMESKYRFCSECGTRIYKKVSF